MVLAQHEEQERRLQRQRRQHAAQPCPGGSLLASTSAASLSAAASGAAPPAAQQPGSDTDAEAPTEQLAAAGPVWAGGADAGGGATAAPSPILGGLKQCLLAYLFREAQRESQVAAAAAACSTAAPSDPPRSLPRISSTSSLPNLTAAAAAPLPGSRFGSSGSLFSMAQGADGGGVGAAAQAHAWRRPLDRFCFYFEAHAELLMWRVSAVTTAAAGRRLQKAVHPAALSACWPTPCLPPRLPSCRRSCWTSSGCSYTGARPRCWRARTATTGALRGAAGMHAWEQGCHQAHLRAAPVTTPPRAPAPSRPGAAPHCRRPACREAAT